MERWRQWREEWTVSDGKDERHLQRPDWKRLVPSLPAKGQI